MKKVSETTIEDPCALNREGMDRQKNTRKATRLRFTREAISRFMQRLSTKETNGNLIQILPNLTGRITTLTAVLFMKSPSQ